MTTEMVLQNWSVINSGNAWTAPECKTAHLQGYIEGGNHRHLGKTNNRNIITSAIKYVDGRRVITINNSVYHLGKVNPQYVEWCKSRGIKFDEENPIHVKKYDRKF